MAQLLHDRLQDKGYNCFFDLDELNSGKFDKKIIDAIADAPNFILVLSQGALDRCVNEEDWVRKEILMAVELGKNIIPVMYDGFEWPSRSADLPHAIKELEYLNCVIGSREYLQAMIDKIIDYMHGYIARTKQTLSIASSTLTVLEAFWQWCDVEAVFKKYGCDIEIVPYKWSDKILRDLSCGKLDMAIYNRKSTLKFNEENGHPITIVRDICSSMGGRNFYIMASKHSKWKNMTLENFKQMLDSDTKIGVAKDSDMFNNLLYILDMTEDELKDRGVSIADFQTSNGLAIFDFIPDLLLIAGQDIRFYAEKTGDYFEIISYDDFPLDKREFFFENSVNSLLVGPSGKEKLKNIDLSAFGVQLVGNFYKNAAQPHSLKDLQAKLSKQLRTLCDDDETIEYIIKKILFETYRIM